MPLYYPKSFVLNDFNGGYISKENFVSLEDNQTNNALNVEIELDGSVRKRYGYRRQLATALTTSASNGGLKINTSATGDAILGHFQLIKQKPGASVKARIVAAGPNLWSYNSQTASVIAEHLNSSNDWYFTQFQDPRSATDDVVIGVNGVDEPKIWNGLEASAVNLSAQTSSTGVMPAKFIEAFKDRVYLLNITDSADVRAKSKVLISGFSEDGGIRPQRFESFFYVGGADKEGEITGRAVLHDQLIIFKRNSTYKFIPGDGTQIDTLNLIQMGEQIGCVAPGSVAVTHNQVVFLSELGVFAFDGNNFKYLSADIEPDIFNANKNIIKQSKAIFYRPKNQYRLCIPDEGDSFPNKVLIFDMTKEIWFPPHTGFDLTSLTTLQDQREVQRIVTGDRHGYLYYHDTGFADGVTATFSGTISSISGSGLIIEDTAANFPTASDGMPVCKMRITGGAGEGKEYTVIGSSSTSTLRISSDEDATALNSTSKYLLGGIQAHYKTKDYDFGVSDVDKKFKRVTVRTIQEGEHSLYVNYILNYKNLAIVPTATISLRGDASIWNTSTYGSAVFGNTELLTRKVGIQATFAQSLTGKNFALRFANDRPFEPWEVDGFDIQLKEIGRR